MKSFKLKVCDLIISIIVVGNRRGRKEHSDFFPVDDLIVFSIGNVGAIATMVKRIEPSSNRKM